MPETIIVAGPGDISDAHAQRYAAKCADVIVADTALGERERERERERGIPRPPQKADRRNCRCRSRRFDKS